MLARDQDFWLKSQVQTFNVSAAHGLSILALGLTCLVSVIELHIAFARRFAFNATREMDIDDREFCKM